MKQAIKPRKGGTKTVKQPAKKKEDKSNVND